MVPGRLVKKILRGEFVDMTELLKDNIEVERRRLSAGDHAQGQRLSRREMPDFESWLQCFSAYAAVICSKYPQKARELWAYQAMMISEHRKCGGRGWLLYDGAFRQQIASLETTNFARINQGLYSTTFLAYGGRGQFCARCMMADHTQEDGTTDGGPDHRNTFLTVQISWICLFISKDLDMLVAARTAPQNSYRNPVERIMSLLNLGLQSIGLMRKEMSEEFKTLIKNSKRSEKLLQTLQAHASI